MFPLATQASAQATSPFSHLRIIQSKVTHLTINHANILLPCLLPYLRAEPYKYAYAVLRLVRFRSIAHKLPIGREKDHGVEQWEIKNPGQHSTQVTEVKHADSERELTSDHEEVGARSMYSGISDTIATSTCDRRT